jgi:ABC-type antimicrobial peptide transport system permease subunit
VQSSAPIGVTGIRAALKELDPSLALDDAAPLASKVRATYALQTFLLNILVFFAMSAGFLIGVGIYGSAAYAAAAEIRATGIRLTLGETREGMIGRVLSRTAGPCVLGSICGALTSVYATRWLSAAAGDGVVVHAAAVFAIVLLALAATSLPAIRAGRIDPIIVLRGS